MTTSKLQYGQEINEPDGSKSIWMYQGVFWGVFDTEGHLLSVWQNKYSAQDAIDRLQA